MKCKYYITYTDMKQSPAPSILIYRRSTTSRECPIHDMDLIPYSTDLVATAAVDGVDDFSNSFASVDADDASASVDAAT